jgi:WD40 repeat protein
MTDNPTPTEEQYAAWLAAREALLAGEPTTLDAGAAVPPDWQQRLDGDLPCLRLLRDVLAPGPSPAPSPSAPFGTHLGRFELRRELGRGSYGLVYLAHDPQLRRDVALKVPRAETLADPGQRERFLREGQAAARLDHPNVVQVYEVGEAGPFCFIASAYCPGSTLAAWLRSRTEPVEVRLAAELAATLAEAVEHAHSRGVLHRDLKPGNVLLEVADNDTGFVPKVTDFGLAKLLGTEEVGQTHSGTVMGTPRYMAPEQAAGRSKEVGPAADVYSLGVILYELLTGRPPFVAESMLDMLEQVRTQEPVPPGRLRPRLPRDLDTICLKCLQKEPQHRYAGAGALAEDLRCLLAGNPISARPTPFWEHAARWARRNPGFAALSAALVLITAVGFGVILALWSGAAASAASEALARGEAEQERRSVQRQLARAALDQGVALCQRGEAGTGLLWLARGLENATRAQDTELQGALRAHLAVWLPEVHTLAHCQQLSGSIAVLALSPDGKTYLTGSSDGTAQLWDLTTGRAQGAPLLHPHPLLALAFSADGRQVATGCQDGARVWETATGRLLGPPLRPGSAVVVVAFRPDGAAVLTGSTPPASVDLWDPATGKRIGPQLPLSQVLIQEWNNNRAHPAFAWLSHITPGWFGGGPESVLTSLGLRSVAFGADGRRVLTVTTPPLTLAQLWDPETWQAIPQGDLRVVPASWAAFRPDNTVLGVTAERVERNQILSFHFRELSTGKPIGSLATPLFPLEDLVFSPTCGHAVGSGGRNAQLFEVATGHRVGAILPHPARVQSLACSRTGPTVLVGCRDGTVRVWQTNQAQPGCRMFQYAAQIPLNPGLGIWNVRFSPDGQILLSWGTETRPEGRMVRSLLTVRLWQAHTGQPIGVLSHPPVPGDFCAVAFSPDGQTVVTGGYDGTVRFWQARTGRPIGAVLAHPGLGSDALVFAANGATLLTGGRYHVRLWDVAACLRAGKGDDPVRPVWEISVAPGAFSHLLSSSDGRLVAVAIEGRNPTIHLFKAETGARICPPLQHPDHAGLGPLPYEELPRLGAFSPDGQILVTRAGETACFWKTDTGQPLGQPVRHAGGVNRVEFHPSGRLLLTQSGPTMRFWEVGPPGGAPSGPQRLAAARPLGPPLEHPEAVEGMAFSPDGRTVATGCGDGMLRFWDVLTGKALGPPRRHGGILRGVRFSPDGRTIATGGTDGTVRLWPVPAPLEGDPERITRSLEVRTGVELDSNGTVQVLDAATWQDRREQLAEMGGPLPQ